MLGNGFLPMFASGAPQLLLTGATWALDGSGRAYNTPTLGSELLTNGGFDSNLSGWTATPGAGGGTIAWLAGGALFTQGASSATMLLSESGGNMVGSWVQAVAELTAQSSGNNTRLRIAVAAASGALSLSAYSGGVRTITITARATTSATWITLEDSQSALATSRWDNASLRVITLSTTFATITGSSATQTAAAKIHTLTTGTQSGVVSLLDSASNPQNFLISYHDGTNVKLDKCVAGVYSNLISAAVAFTSNAPIEIRRPSGNTFQLWYNGVQRGADQTVSDASIINNTLYGLFSTYSGNLFTEFSLGGAVIPFGF